MSTAVRATWSVHTRDLRLLMRDHSLVAQTFILPTAILLLVASVFGGSGGDRWPVAVVDESGHASGARVVQALADAESGITPYFALHHMSDLRAAREAVEAGRMHLLVHLPPDFETDEVVRTFVHNVNTDAMKNVRQRLDYAVVTEHPDFAGVRMDVDRPAVAVWRSAYIGGSAVLLALLLGALLVPANLLAFEREHRTRPAALLTPVGPAAAGLGHVLTGVVAAVAASLLPLAVSIVAFNLDISWPRLAGVYAALLPLLVGLGGAGILIGHVLRTFSNIQPAIVIGTLVTFFGAGGFVATTMLHPALQRFADIWLPSRLFTWFNPVLHGFTQFTGGQLAAFAAAAVVGVTLVPLTYELEQRSPPRPASM